MLTRVVKFLGRMSKIIQCVPNFSEGRNIKVIESIVDAAKSNSSARIADYSWDADHNRMVLTLIGSPDEIYDAIMGAAVEASRLIDLRKHKGGHPRIGATDVVPLVPVRDISMEECIELSYRIGGDIANELDIPVYYYEESALNASHKLLPNIRKGGFESLSAGKLEGDRKPDAGPEWVHPSAGATVIGARKPLVAYNVNLDTYDINAAREIVKSIRANADELPGLKAISVDLKNRGIVQVAMNITMPDILPVEKVFNFVKLEAQNLGIDVAESEFIGIVSKEYLKNTSIEELKAKSFKDSQILENWLW